MEDFVSNQNHKKDKQSFFDTYSKTVNLGRERVLTIDIYRVLFSILVLLHHTYLLNTPNGETILFGGYRSVEFFFLLTGFLMARTADNKKRVQVSTLGSETFRYVLKKIIRVYPYYFVCFIQTFVIVQIISYHGKRELFWKTVFSWSELAFLRMGGVIKQMYNGPTWYLSATFIATLLIYPLLRLNSNFFQYVLAPLFCIVIYGYCASTFQTLEVIYQWNGIGYSGILRAIAGLSCGCICFAAVNYLKRIKWVRRKIISDSLLILGGMLFLGIVVFAQLTVIGMDTDFQLNMDFTGLLLSALLVITMFAREAIILPEYAWGGAEKRRRMCSFLGNFSLSLYCSHRFWIYLINFLWPKRMAFKMIALYIVGSVVLALVNMFFARFLLLSFRKMKQKMKDYLT